MLFSTIQVRNIPSRDRAPQSSLCHVKCDCNACDVVTKIFNLKLAMSKRKGEQVLSQAELEGDAADDAYITYSRLQVRDMGEFEDAWEDEIESEEEVNNRGSGEDEDGAPPG